MSIPPKLPWSRKNDYGRFINKLFIECEKNPHKTLSINTLSIESGIEKRRIYDLMNVLLACNICRRIDTHSFLWNGIQQIPSALQQISFQIETKASTQNLEQLFILPTGPGIGLMTNNFLASYMYFGQIEMNIRDIALLMSVDLDKAKPILRRLYLVAFLLERTGLLSRSPKIGEYTILANIFEIQKNTFIKMQKDGLFPPHSVEFMLSRIDDVFLNKFCYSRKKILIYLLSQKANRTSSNSDNVEASVELQISRIIED